MEPKSEKDSLKERSEYYGNHLGLLEQRKAILCELIDKMETEQTINKDLKSYKNKLELNTLQIELSDIDASIESTASLFATYKARYEAIVKNEEFLTAQCEENYEVYVEKLKSLKIKSLSNKLTKEHKEQYDKFLYEVDWEDSETRKDQFKKNTLFRLIVSMVEHIETLK